MQDSKQKITAKAFAEKWKDRGYEKGESQTFWLELLHNVLGVENPYDVITFENQVQLSHTSFIDAYIIPTKMLIEQICMMNFALTELPVQGMRVKEMEIQKLKSVYYYAI